MIRWAVRAGDWLGSRLPSPHDARLALAVRLLCGQPIIYGVEIDLHNQTIGSLDTNKPFAGGNFSILWSDDSEPTLMPWEWHPETLS